jgi:hypothetical protein
MKMTTALWIAMGLVSHSVLAQSDATTGNQQPPMQSQPGMQSGTSSDTQDWSGSGASDTGSETQSGAQSDMIDHASSGASNGMQSEAGPEFNSAPPVTQLQEKTQNDVAYLCGGVGQEEAAYMKQQAKGYDLMLTFATQKGSYLADVDVSIKNAKGDSVLQAKCDAPMLLVNLPKSGTYRIRAETAGYSLNRTARVTASQNKAQRVARVSMVWPQRVADAGTSPEISSGSSDNRNGASGNSDENGYERSNEGGDSMNQPGNNSNSQ